jgi:hypothetical protein
LHDVVVPPPSRRLPLLAALLALGLLAACGKDAAPHHGLRVRPLDSHPRGEPIRPRFVTRDGQVWRARVALRMAVDRETSGGDGPRHLRRSGRAVLSLTWTFHHPKEGGTPTSTVVLRWVEAEGADAKAYLARPALTCTLKHQADGRPISSSLHVEGGDRGARIEAHDLLGQLLLAGFGGSPPWTPPRPIRAGEAWRLESFVHPRALDNVAGYVKDVGLAAPTPHFEGTARLEAVRPGGEPGERLLDLRMDALLSIEGHVAKNGVTGRLSLGDHVEGRATVSALTGVPVSFDLDQVRHTDVRTPEGPSRMTVTSHVHGDVEPVP